MSGITDRVSAPAAPAAAAAAAAPTIARRMPDDARPPEPSPEADAGQRPGPPHARHSSGVPDPSGRSGSLVDVFA